MIVRSMDVGRVWDCMLCACVSEESGEGEGTGSEASSLLSYTLRYVSLTELGTLLCQFGLREPMHLYACVSEEGGNGEGADIPFQSFPTKITLGLRSAISAVIG